MRSVLVFAIVLTIVFVFVSTPSDACLQCRELGDRIGCVSGYSTGFFTCTVEQGPHSIVCSVFGECPSPKKKKPVLAGADDFAAIAIWKANDDGGLDFKFGLMSSNVEGPDFVSPMFMRSLAAEFDGVPAKAVQNLTWFTVLTSEREGFQDWRIGDIQFLSISVWPRGKVLEVALCTEGESFGPGESRMLKRAVLGENKVLVTPVFIDGERYLFTMHAKPALPADDPGMADYLQAQQFGFMDEMELIPRLDKHVAIQRSGPVSSCNQLEPMQPEELTDGEGGSITVYSMPPEPSPE